MSEDAKTVTFGVMLATLSCVGIIVAVDLWR
jgi:hypothetical protein